MPASSLAKSDYVLQLAPGLCLDAQNSRHFSRYFNHDQHGNLDVVVDEKERRADFWASRRIKKGEEMCFDYGYYFWLAKAQMGISPAAGSDSHNFYIDMEAESPFLSW